MATATAHLPPVLRVLQLDHLTGEIDPATSTSGSYVVTYTTQLGSSTCTATVL
ncbi:MAG: hypothetical protein IPL33_11415 [Sphingobacteriales bacterium]|nr:hypothetical protein [Sphingobacteriales bacterium]